MIEKLVLHIDRRRGGGTELMPIRSAAKELLLSGPLLKRGLCKGDGFASISLYLVIFVPKRTTLRINLFKYVGERRVVQ